jgi:hypothetical protein
VKRDLRRISTRIGRKGFLALVALALTAGTLSAATGARATTSAYTPADVTTAVANGVAYIDAHQNADGSFGTSFAPAETAFALMAYGALDHGNVNNLLPAQRTHVQNAVGYLLSQQRADGHFADGYTTYTTGLALDALAASSGADPGIPEAISRARTYLIGAQNAPPECSTDDHSGTDYYCGGWNYDADGGRSDESNSGFALTGLALSGGVPADTAAANIGWQRHIQQLTATNYYASQNDGGGCYQPASFCTANDTGSLLFSYGYDGVAKSDPKVQAALTISTDTLDEYELMKDTVRSSLSHTGANADGTCVIGAGCDWVVHGDGGYHYSIWGLTKGFAQYIAPDLTEASNWYAKVVDLLLSQQVADGSWPVDGRDDFTSIVATSFAVDALALVGATGCPLDVPITPPNSADTCVTANVVSTITVTAPALVSFGSVAVGETAGPAAAPVNVKSNDDGGYQLSVTRTAFTNGDLPLSIDSAVPPAGTALDLSGLTAIPLGPLNLSIGHRAGSITPAEGDTWPLSLTLGPIPATATGTHASIVTFTAVGF